MNNGQNKQSTHTSQQSTINKWRYAIKVTSASSPLRPGQDWQSTCIDTNNQ